MLEYFLKESADCKQHGPLSRCFTSGYLHNNATVEREFPNSILINRFVRTPEFMCPTISMHITNRNYSPTVLHISASMVVSGSKDDGVSSRYYKNFEEYIWTMLGNIPLSILTPATVSCLSTSMLQRNFNLNILCTSPRTMPGPSYNRQKRGKRGKLNSRTKVQCHHPIQTKPSFLSPSATGTRVDSSQIQL